MSQWSTRTRAIAGGAALVITAAVISAVVLVSSARAGGVELTSAEFVPADAGIYIALNTDLASKQWVNTFTLLARMGQEDAEDELRDAAFDADLDWENDVAPFLGGNIGVYLRSFDVESAAFEGGVIVRCADAEQALEVFRRKSGADFTSASHEGTDYLRSEDAGLFVARVQDHLLLANEERSLFAMLDAQRGDQGRLGKDKQFNSLRGKIDDDFLGFVYVNAEHLASSLELDDPAFRDALRQSQADGLVYEPAGMVLVASGDAFKTQLVSAGDSEGVSPLVEPRESRFAEMVPAETALFVSTAGLSQVWDEVMSKARKQIDDAIAQSGEYRNLDEALREGGQQIGLRSLEDLIRLFTSETSLALWFTSGADKPDGVLLAGVRDDNEARRVMQNIARSSNGGTTTERVGDVDMTVWSTDDDTLAYAVTDGYLAVGTRAAVRSTLEGRGPHLTESEAYRDAVAELPGKLGTFAYFDVPALIRAGDPGIDELDEAQRALGGAMLNIVEQDDTMRLSGVLVVQEQ